MSYLLVVVIGVVAGWVAGRYIKGSESGVGIDLAAGGIGAVLAVLLMRLVGLGSSGAWVMTTFVAIIGSVGSLYAMRRVLRARMVPAPRTTSKRR